MTNDGRMPCERCTTYLRQDAGWVQGGGGGLGEGKWGVPSVKTGCENDFQDPCVLHIIKTVHPAPPPPPPLPPTTHTIAQHRGAIETSRAPLA